MVKTALMLIAIFMTSFCCALEKLSDKYLISYGDPQATVKITQFFSFMCPHCAALFKREFQEMKAQYLDTNKISFTFHPVPMDLLTVSAMDCLEKLNEMEKKAFLEVILEEIEAEDPIISMALMKKAMEVFKKPIPHLEEQEYLQETNTFQDAFNFLKQEEQISAIPTIEVNGKLYPSDVPNLQFIGSILKENPTREVHNAL